MSESNFESGIRGDIHNNHWVSLIKWGLLAGLIVFCTLVSFDFGLKLFEDRLAAVGLALLVFISLVFFFLKFAKRESRRTTQGNEDLFDEIEPLKPLWGNGDEIFAKEWVLSLSTKVPKVSFVSEASVEELYRKIGYYYSAAKAAVSYFPDGKYLIGHDGSMCKIDDSETVVLSGLLQVNATIDFMDLPYFETIEHRLEMKPTNFMETAKNCVLLDVHAHGVENGTEEHYMPRFAVRDGKIIVESF